MQIQKFTSRNTKTEILKAYNELAKAYRDLESAKPASPTTTALVKSTPAAAPAAPARVDGLLSVEDVIAQLSRLSERIGASTGTLQQRLTNEATRLEALREQSAACVSRLAELHNISFDDATLDRVIGEFKETEGKAEEDLKVRAEAFKKEISARRDAWRKEQDEHGREVKERMIELKKTRTRDAQEYKYELELRHRAEDDEMDQQQKAVEATLAALREEKETQWAAREKELAAREQEFAELKDKAEKFPKNLERAVKEAESEGMSIARRKTKTEADLLAKEHEGKERVYKLRVKSLEDTIAKQAEQIKDLSGQLEGTNKRAQDLAVRAIDGASNANSYQAIQQIAMEQAKNFGKGK